MSDSSMVQDAKAIYDDLICNVVLSSGVKGHLKVLSKVPFKDANEISDSDFSHLFFISNFCATGIFEKLGAQGTNIIVNNEDKTYSIDIIPRSDGDGFKLNWELKPGDSGELDSIASKIKDEMDILVSKTKVEKKQEKSDDSKNNEKEKKKDTLVSDMPLAPKEFLDEDDELSETKERESNYLLSELRRIP